MIKQYETVFIATPVLSEAQMKEAVAKYVDFIQANGGEIVYEEDWGLKQLAYPIQHKTTGFYHLIEFKADSQLVAARPSITVTSASSASSPSPSTRTPSLTLRSAAPTVRLKLNRTNLRRKELWHRIPRTAKSAISTLRPSR